MIQRPNSNVRVEFDVSKTSSGWEDLVAPSNVARPLVVWEVTGSVGPLLGDSNRYGQL